MNAAFAHLASTLNFLSRHADLFERFNADGSGGKVSHFARKPIDYPDSAIPWSRVRGRYFYPWATAGDCAKQQALRLHFKLTYTEVGHIAHCHPRTAWQHINRAEQGAGVTAWRNRTFEQRRAAINAAARLYRA